MSMFADLFAADSAGSSKAEPLPTRDTAADATAAAEADRQRRALTAGGYTGMLSGPSGVLTETVGSRSAGGG